MTLILITLIFSIIVSRIIYNSLIRKYNLDNKNSILRWSMRVSKDIEDEVGMAIIDGIANGVLDDMPIWDNKSYVANPILCDGDGPINKFRKWVSQFYSEIPDTA